jgi:hypothetical protein
MKKCIFSLMLLPAIVSLAWTEPPPTCCNDDSPQCACFIDLGAWDPSGTWIQDIALATLGTRESCVSNGGKPYYQMRLGYNDRNSAQAFACFFWAMSDLWWYSIWPFERDAWCSEAVSYWHREVAIPYSRGYGTGTWLFDWRLGDTYAIETFYTTEEASGGRGRWIDWSDLDYDDLQPGINAPVPGSYVLIRKYDTITDPPEWNGGSHSLIINEMTVHQSTSGEVVRVEISLLEGNSGNAVKASTVYDDILSLTPAGSEFIGSNRKIKGFGVDLDSDGSPIYDPDRLHWVRCGIIRPVKEIAVEVKDPLWEKHYAERIPKLVSYAKKVRNGISLLSSSKIIQVNAIPDGHKNYWLFPHKIDDLDPQGVEINIDLLDEHPLPIIGIIVNWRGFIPQGYRVQWAGADARFHEVSMPTLDVENVSSAQREFAVPVPIVFSKSGTAVRYVKLFFPPGTFLKDTRLDELRFIYNWGPGKDEEYNPCEELKRDLQKNE